MGEWGEGFLPILLPLTQACWSEPLGVGGGGKSNYVPSLIKIPQWFPIVVRITFPLLMAAFQAFHEPAAAEFLQQSLPAVLPHLCQLHVPGAPQTCSCLQAFAPEAFSSKSCKTGSCPSFGSKLPPQRASSSITNQLNETSLQLSCSHPWGLFYL